MAGKKDKEKTTVGISGGGSNGPSSSVTPGDGGGGDVPKGLGYKVSKVMLWPSRKINLGNYSTIDLNAGVEIVFDKPVLMGSDEMVKACDSARKFIGEEYRRQLNAFGVKSSKPAGKVDTKPTS